MNNPKKIDRISLMLIGSVLLCMAPAIVAAETPNIVFMYADDLGFSDLACYDHPYARTPALDRLASEGTRFTQAYSTGRTCLPSRTGYMTGLAPQRFADAPVADYGFGEHITITELLKNHGYRTGHFGKWHIGPVETPGTYGIEEIDTPSDNPGDALPGGDGTLYNNAISFIERHNQNHPGVPFYVNIWGHRTHYAVNPLPEYVAEFAGLVVDRDDFFTHVVNPYTDEMGIQEKFDQIVDLPTFVSLDTSMQNYLGDVWSIDLNVARVLDTLDQLGLAENTIVVFSSDQGPAPVTGDGDYKPNMLGYSGIYRGDKGSQYEGNNRVPFIIRWPGHIAADVVDTDNVISGMDWLPTLCSIAGIDDLPNGLDGEDVSDIWFGATRPREKTQFWASVSGGVNISIRKGYWKLHHNINDTSRTETELYDLSIDPSEDNNVKGDNPAVVDELVADIEEWSNNWTNDPVPDVVGLDQSTAETDIVTAGFAVGTVTTSYSSTVPPGDVISQDPAAGTYLPAGTSVDIVVSLGIEPIDPDLTGLAMLGVRWLDTSCIAPSWCDGTDLDESGDVGLDDVVILAEYWLDWLIHHWELDETSGAVAPDATAYTADACDGTLMNMDDSDWVAGKTGNALDFDGVNDYVAIDGVCATMISKDVTVSAWVKAPAVNPANQFMISINTANGDDNKLLCGTPAGTATLSLADSEPLWRHTTATVIDNTWHHIAYVLEDSSDTITVYVDGAEVLSFASTVSIAADDVFSLAQEYDAGMTPGDFYDGLIDNVRVYDYALSETEIAALAQ